MLHRSQSSDAADVAVAVNESLPELSEWMPWCHAGYSQNEALEFITPRMQMWEERTECVFAIRGHDGLFLGTCGLNEIRHDRKAANLGYWLRTSATGRGHATEAAELAARFGIQQLGLMRIEIVVDVDNVRSQRVAERLGANREGVLINRLVMGDEFRDAVLYSITPETLKPESLEPESLKNARLSS
ncbi:MAG: GNAT family N-acetyltransferase [Pirellulaceae bacterium]|nr:GNAT family N-acetyltransferase [Pirellulaceae bacterium]